MSLLSIHFLSAEYSALGITLLVLGAAIAVLLASAISRVAYFTCKSHLLLEEMQKDLRKLVTLQLQLQQRPGGTLSAQSPTEDLAALELAPQDQSVPDDRPSN